jgi:hypothetical protein
MLPTTGGTGNHEAPDRRPFLDRRHHSRAAALRAAARKRIPAWSSTPSRRPGRRRCSRACVKSAPDSQSLRPRRVQPRRAAGARRANWRARATTRQSSCRIPGSRPCCPASPAFPRASASGRSARPAAQPHPYASMKRRCRNWPSATPCSPRTGTRRRRRSPRRTSKRPGQRARHPGALGLEAAPRRSPSAPAPSTARPSAGRRALSPHWPAVLRRPTFRSG